MRNKGGILCMVAGAVLILSALLLLIHNRQEDRQAGQAAEELLASVQRAMAEPDQTLVSDASEPSPAQEELPAPDAAPAPEPVSEPAATEPAPAPETAQTPVLTGAETGSTATAAQWNSTDYLGYLSLPSLGLELPVFSGWDAYRLALAPCRQFGSVNEENLVIAGHNYINHFGSLASMRVGDTVSLTTMDGSVYRYTVSELQTLQPTDVALVADSGYPLVLYTCTYSSAARVVVYCSQTE